MSAQRITFDDLADFILGELGDTAESIWTKDDDIIPWIVDTLHDFAPRTLISWRRELLSYVAGDATYVIPTSYNFYQLDRAEYDYQVVNPVPARYLMSEQGSFESTGNRPLSLLMEGDGVDTIRKIGVPEDSSDLFYIEFFSLGFPLTGSGSGVFDSSVFDPLIFDTGDTTLNAVEIELPIRYLYGTVAAGVKAKAFARDGDGQSEAMSQFWNSVYEDGVDMVIRRRETLFKRRISNIGSDGKVVTGGRRDPGTLPAYFPAIK